MFHDNVTSQRLPPTEMCNAGSDEVLSVAAVAVHWGGGGHNLSVAFGAEIDERRYTAGLHVPTMSV
jgi:hypothetical protein